MFNYQTANKQRLKNRRFYIKEKVEKCGYSAVPTITPQSLSQAN